jgi:hypothetical protein
MVPFGHSVSRPEVRVGRSLGRMPTGAFVIHASTWLGVLFVLPLAGWRVGEALGSPLLAVVASGMLFLIGVSLRSAIEPRRP